MAHALAEEACHIEIDRLSRAVGKQDQYIAAFGGLTCFEFASSDEVRVSPLRISNRTLHDLEERLMLFFTGYSRSAESMLEDQKTRSEQDDRAMLQNLHEVARIGCRGGRQHSRIRRADARALADEAEALGRHVRHRRRPLV